MQGHYHSCHKKTDQNELSEVETLSYQVEDQIAQDFFFRP